MNIAHPFGRCLRLYGDVRPEPYNLGIGAGTSDGVTVPELRLRLYVRMFDNACR
ncbi:MAG: hypothetical protein GIW99_02560 [Candidatus Eremiobacteraeota bacterium]|nr:hypothetical protein [Candidatus Eremiobacteraeota bacterium]MBC5826557.1 hypothetical protein [Candidatus Eremiobacteraeota bacterium]